MTPSMSYRGLPIVHRLPPNGGEGSPLSVTPGIAIFNAMKIAVLGTGMVGTAIGTKLVSLGHDVKMGSRTEGNEKAAAWVDAAGRRATHGTFASAAAHGEIVFNCTSGAGALDALAAAGAENLGDKILIDLSNPLVFARGAPPTLQFHGDDSLAERIQKAFPRSRVVKTLNTVTAAVMVDPGRVHGEHDAFVSGNDAAAKAEVTGLLKSWFGWKNVVDLGDLSTARGTEAYLLFWLRLRGAVGTNDFNIHVTR
jgi:8-hydroxy-5-deazaflavin:NADPH oxidoreductase